jgi:hypothetical protein
MKKFSVIMLVFLILSGCNAFELHHQRMIIINNYKHMLYPEDTIIYGIVESISSETTKRAGDLFFSQTNKVIIKSDATNFSVNVDKLTFNINDSVKVVIERSKLKGEFNDIKTIIYPAFGEKTKTYYKFINLNYKEIVDAEIKKIE